MEVYVYVFIKLYMYVCECYGLILLDVLKMICDIFNFLGIILYLV
jgi:hypothetical protein